MGKNSNMLKKEDKHMNNAKMPVPKKILLLFFIICFLVSAFEITKWYFQTSKTENEYKELATQVINEPQNKVEGNGIDFKKLKQLNPETIAWIKINNTEIDYPVVQATNNEYYLRNNFYKENSVSGSIFADYRNNKNLTDKNILVYGHNMKNGSMFADLTDIYQGKLGSDITINLFSEQKQLDFKVFSCYNTEPDEYSLSTTISEANYDEFLNNLKSRSERNFDIDPHGSNQVLTLSTCSENGKNRIIVHASLDKVNF